MRFAFVAIPRLSLSLSSPRFAVSCVCSLSSLLPLFSRVLSLLSESSFSCRNRASRPSPFRFCCFRPLVDIIQDCNEDISRSESKIQDTMGKHVSIHFKYKSIMYSLLVKTSIEEITLTIVEAMICKKFGLDEKTVKFKFSYIPLLVGCEEYVTVADTDDLVVYLNTTDNNGCRCILHVEVTSSSKSPTAQVSRAEKESSFGVNYEANREDDDENEANALTLYVGNRETEQEEEAEQQEEAMEEDDDTCEGNSMDRSYRHDDEYDLAPVVESSQYTEPWEDGLGVTLLQEFPNKKAVQRLVDRTAFENSFGFVLVKSDKDRYVVKCRHKSCEWKLRAAKVRNTPYSFLIRTHNKMHTCSRASQGTSKRRKGTRELVAAMLHEDYPGLMETPTPKTIQNLVQTKFGVKISYSTALRGKNLHIYDLRGNPEDSYKKLYCYLHMLEKVNPGTRTSVKLNGVGQFLYLFIALGASIEGFQCMRKVIAVDATHLKNGYRGVLVFASAQDPNRHNYPLAFGVLDSENNDSWSWFFEMLKTVVPDSSELVFMSDRNASLTTAVANVYPTAHHGYCIRHLSQNVKDRAFNVNKHVVAWKFMELSRHYTVPEFENAYIEFHARFPSAAKYLEETTENVKETWARVYFPGERYNIDTSNCVESLNSTFKTARKYSLIPMLDSIIAKISEWFNEHRKEAAAGSAEHKLVPLVENFMHKTWKEAEKLHVTELHSFELLYDVVDKQPDGSIADNSKHFTVDLIKKGCSCRVFDVEKYPCVHAVAAFMEFNSSNVDSSRYPMQLHELVSRYYWKEVWVLAYWRTVFFVPDESEWNVPDDIKAKKIIPLQPIPKKGRKRSSRFFGPGERRRRTQNKRRPRQVSMWSVFEEPSQANTV